MVAAKPIAQVLVVFTGEISADFQLLASTTVAGPASTTEPLTFVSRYTLKIKPETVNVSVNVTACTYMYE